MSYLLSEILGWKDEEVPLATFSTRDRARRYAQHHAAKILRWRKATPDDTYEVGSAHDIALYSIQQLPHNPETT
jgi:hypothetical protein